jgi:hypothetical protein
VKPQARSTIAATCEWTLEGIEGTDWTVIVKETWKCADFNEIAGSTAFCPGETGTREWVYRVTPEGEVRLFVDRGDPPPEALGEVAETPAPTIAPTP